MVKTVVLALKNAVPGHVLDAISVFEKVNEFAAESGKGPLFHCTVAGASETISYNQGLITLKADETLTNIGKPDLVIVPALTGHAPGTTYINKEFAATLARLYKEGAELAAFGTGTFLLAYSGVLNNHESTTHWSYAAEFRYYYPGVKLIEERMVTHDNGLYTCGGGIAHWNLLMHLTERYCGRDMAIRLAKYFVVELDKNNQSAFVIFNGLKDHGDQAVLKIQNFIEKNYREKMSIEELSDMHHLTRRTLERRFRKATRLTVMEYIQRVKVEACKKQLEIGRKAISEVMADIGYTDTQAFRDLFRKYTGMTPVVYKQKYSR